MSIARFPLVCVAALTVSGCAFEVAPPDAPEVRGLAEGLALRACDRGRSALGAPMTVAAGGSNQRVLLRGTVVTPDGVIDGEVLVDGDTISCVAPSCARSGGYARARIVETRGIILPGLIDTHNHVPFNIFDESDWAPARIYENRSQWPLEPSYDAMRSAKQYVNGEDGSPVDYSCELNKYGEVKALIAGTTSVVTASGPSNQACYGSLARTIDQAQNGLPADKIALATFLPNTANADSVCAAIENDVVDAYVVHVAEGIDQASRDEFYTLGSVSTNGGCLYAPETAIVHGVALGDPELTTMAEAGMSLVWSPHSNIVLYGATTDIPLARARGINVALAPDWSLTGSQNLLDELRFANRVDDTHWGNQLSAEDLFEMATSRAAAALGLQDVLGVIAPGHKADLTVITGDPCAPYDALLSATPANVRLVMVGGVALYGDAALSALGPTSPGCEPLAVCGVAKFLCAATTVTTDKLGQTFAVVQATLGDALADYDAANATSFSPIAPIVKCQ
jgi:cytosine/adenosine deaminase-related metal-dependent hydrolase